MITRNIKKNAEEQKEATSLMEESGQTPSAPRMKTSQCFSFSEKDIQFFSRYRKATPGEIAKDKNLLKQVVSRQGSQVVTHFVKEDIRVVCEKILGFSVRVNDETGEVALLTSKAVVSDSPVGSYLTTPNVIRMLGVGSVNEVEEGEITSESDELSFEQTGNPITPRGISLSDDEAVEQDEERRNPITPRGSSLSDDEAVEQDEERGNPITPRGISLSDDEAVDIEEEREITFESPEEPSFEETGNPITPRDTYQIDDESQDEAKEEQVVALANAYHARGMLLHPVNAKSESVQANGAEHSKEPNAKRRKM